MQTFLTYSSMKKPSSPVVKWLIILVIVLGVISSVWFGGKYYLKTANDKKIRQVSIAAVTALISQGTYESIKPFVTSDYLGDQKEEEFNKAAEALTNLKDSKVEILNQSEAGAFGTLKPKNVETQGEYLYGFSISIEKSGLNTIKIKSIETDYGKQSYFDGNRE